MQFMASRIQRKPTGYLMSLTQDSDESLKNYIMGFNQEKLTLENPSEEFIFVALYCEIRANRHLMAELARRSPNSP
jgi:hypothetical protein